VAKKKPAKADAVPKVSAPAELIIAEPPIPPEIIEQVLLLLISGQREFTVREFIREQLPTVSADRLLLAVAQRLIDDGNISGTLVRGWTFNAMQNVYRVALAGGDVRVALRTAEQILKHFGDS
jgi:hypothetical protein